MIPGVILAAGRSSRMGRLKPLLPLGTHDTFLSRLVRVLREGGADEIVVVVGHEAEAVCRAIEQDRLNVRPVRNPRYAEGQLSSVVAALAVVDRPGVRAALVIPVDMPLVGVSTVRAIVEAYERTKAPIIRPVRDGVHGHPVLFDRTVFADLRQADPSVGARAVVRARAAQVLDVAVDDAGAFLDIDTPEDYERIPGGIVG
ncbi:MAG TPA: nucleotidyltransferase family protein [Vicinamibacterales bacterium]|nr:nucleotidyltransferase family protein [Vicinamibacterales bacterium]